MTSYAYKFSVVVPVYLVAGYLEEALDSVLAQTIGFEDNIQLVLVNDGSPDDCESICIRYRDKYPENITYVRQENAGVSCSRNKGMEYVSGEYVNFLDGDDKWEADAFERVAGFFEAHPGVDVVAGRQMFFDAGSGGHPLNYRFVGDRVIDVVDEPNVPQLSVTAAFIRHSALEGRSFDPRLKYSEDFRLLVPIIVESGGYGAMESVTHWYRRRPERNSALNESVRSRSWYFDTPHYCYQELFAYSQERFGCVVPYVQYCVMYDLQWRLRTPLGADLTPEEAARYRGVIAALLAQIDDEVILAQHRLPVEHRLYAFALKTGVSVEALRRGLQIKGRTVFYNGRVVRSLKQQQKLVIEILEFESGSLRIEGYVNSVLEKSAVTVAFDVAGERVDAMLLDRPERSGYCLGELVNEPVGFTAVIPLGEEQTVAAVLGMRGVVVAPALAFGIHARLTHSMNSSYFTDGGWFASLGRKANSIRVNRDTRLHAVVRRERRYLEELVREKGRRDLAWYRLLRFVLKPLLLGRKVWVVSDRINMARDNGEAFFRYLQKHRSWRVLPYFALSPDSPDYVAMKRVGRVVVHDSAKYRLLMLLSDAVVSSSADDHTTSPFGVDDAYMKNLYSFTFAFLQHGITTHDLSRWLNKYRKNIGIFVTSTVPEWESVVQGRYYYDEKVVKLTGLPRWDAFMHDGSPVEKKIVVMPTWRKALCGPTDWATGLRQPFPGFAETEFFRFFNTLINDPRLLAVMTAKGYTAKFVMHPCMIQEAGLFEANDAVTIETKCDYQHEFKTSKLLVTDYSSVAFDFANLGKPVVYAQFDRDSFYQGQIYEEGYFHHEQHGFGPVCTDYEQTISTIIEAVEGDCVVSDLYRKRAAAFFYRGKLSSCESIYRAILEA